MLLLNHDEPDFDITEETVPQVLSRLIRSKEDALAVHQLLEDHIHFTGEGRDRCQTIGEILDLWNSFSFAEYFDGLQVEVEELDHLFQNTKTMGVNCPSMLLQSLILAAERQAEQLQDKFNFRI